MTLLSGSLEFRMCSAFSPQSPPNTACTRPPQEHRGRDGGSLRVFEQFAWLEVGSVKAAVSRPAHAARRVTHTVRRLE